jgi:hypothetical protein
LRLKLDGHPDRLFLTREMGQSDELSQPDEINWVQIVLKMALGLILFSNFLAPFAARAQNLGTSPQFGQAVQGQQATTAEAPSSTL